MDRQRPAPRRLIGGRAFTVRQPSSFKFTLRHAYVRGNDMKFFILFGLLTAVIGDLTFNDAQYTKAFGHGLTAFGDALRGSSQSLWGA